MRLSEPGAERDCACEESEDLGDAECGLTSVKRLDVRFVRGNSILNIVQEGDDCQVGADRNFGASGFRVG